MNSNAKHVVRCPHCGKDLPQDTTRRVLPHRAPGSNLACPGGGRYPLRKVRR